MKVSIFINVEPGLIASSLKSAQWALVQGEQIVVPRAISISPQVSGFAIFPDYADVSLFPARRVLNVEGIRFCIDTLNDLFPCPFPTGIWIAKVCDVLMGTVHIRFGNACHYYVSHCEFLS
jgi:hypothetical protein